MPDQAELLAEAYRRGILPPDKKAMYEEAQKRGLFVSSDIKRQSSGETPVKSGFSTMVSNIPGSAENLATGMLQTGYGAAKALISPNPMDKVNFIKDVAVGTWDTLKQRYGKGITQALENDPVGVLTDAISLATGVRGGIRAGTPVPETAAMVPTKAAARATKDVAGKFAADQTTPGQVGTALAERPGVAAPLDVGGTAVTDTVERLGQTSMAGRQVIEPYLTDRQKGQLDRISTDLTELTGSKRTAFQATERTMKERADAAAPAYKAAYQAGDQAIWSDKLEQLAESDALPAAMRTAVRQWRDSAIADGYGSMSPGAKVVSGGLIKFSNDRIPAFPNLQFWDYTKRAMDTMVRNSYKDGKSTERTRTLSRITEQLRNELDQVAPEYKAARDQWGGHTNYLNALEDGKNILTKSESIEEMQANFRGLDAASKQGYRESVVSTILSKMQNNPAELADLTRDLKSPAMRAKINEIMPTPEAKAAWNKRLDFEIKSSKLVAVGLKGSPTARRAAQANEAAGLAADLAVAIFTGTPPKTLMTRLTLGYAQKVRDSLLARRDVEMAKILTGKGRTEVLQSTPASRGKPSFFGLPGLSDQPQANQ